MKYILIVLMVLNPLLINASSGNTRNDKRTIKQIPEYLNGASTWEELAFKVEPFLSAADMNFFKTVIVKTKNAKLPKIEIDGSRWIIKTKEKNLIEVNPEKREFTVAGKKVLIKGGATLESVYESVRAALPKNVSGVSIDFSLIPKASAQDVLGAVTCAVDPYCLAAAVVTGVAFGAYLFWQTHQNTSTNETIDDASTCALALDQSLRNHGYNYRIICDKNNTYFLEFAKARTGGNGTSLRGEAEYWVRLENGNIFYGAKNDPLNSKNNEVNGAFGGTWTSFAGNQISCMNNFYGRCVPRNVEPAKVREGAK